MPEPALPIADGLLKHIGKDPDADGQTLLVWTRGDEQGEKPQTMRLTRVTAVTGSTVWRECAQLMARGALTGYGSLITRYGEHQYFTQVTGSAMQFYAPDDDFSQVLVAFRYGWLAARGQADGSTWHPGEAERIGLNLATSAMTEHSVAIMDLGGERELEEIWEEDREAMDEAATPEQKRAAMQRTILRLNTLRPKLEAGGEC